MIGSARRSPDPTHEKREWIVFIDEEMHPISLEHIRREGPYSPLAERLRNTIAHELVHSLAFRPTDFGISQMWTEPKASSPAEFVKLVERHTERLSPLLLWPESALRTRLQNQREQVSIDDLVKARRHMGISRYILINRLANLNQYDPNDLRHSLALQNIGIGLGEWREKGRCIVKSWPLFGRFERNDVPAFLRKIRQQDGTPAEAVFPDSSFAMCGGHNRSVTCVVDAGTARNPRSTTFSVELSMEATDQSPGSNFLFVVRGPRSKLVPSEEGVMAPWE
jgi:hypothetical protein